eukprot:TRINITY_DN895_c0_g1_i3.p1 TRINITY_DN895_c0_g1~~TRINITY_DN895_c0_g1_i3.p1  ORF type:complete len:344 (+),score=83.28 TRINITY_DN895_c0_g1_i3:105-1034(+)
MSGKDILDIEKLAQYTSDEEDDGVKTKQTDKPKDTHVALHASGFREFLLKPEIFRAIVDCGFEHPSEVQHQCIPQAILGTDVICQAKSGMGKTAVFVLSVLQQLDSNPSPVSALIMCHARELAYQICHEFERFKKYMPNIKTAVLYGGIPIQTHRDLLKDEQPHIIIGTPGRVKALCQEKVLNLKNCKYFVIDECDRVLETLDMRADIQAIFKMTPHTKQTMMFSATLSDDIRQVCKKFMHNNNNEGGSGSHHDITYNMMMICFMLCRLIRLYSSLDLTKPQYISSSLSSSIIKHFPTPSSLQHLARII